MCFVVNKITNFKSILGNYQIIYLIYNRCYIRVLNDLTIFVKI